MNVSREEGVRHDGSVASEFLVFEPELKIGGFACSFGDARTPLVDRREGGKLRAWAVAFADHVHDSVDKTVEADNSGFVSDGGGFLGEFGECLGEVIHRKAGPLRESGGDGSATSIFGLFLNWRRAHGVSPFR